MIKSGNKTTGVGKSIKLVSIASFLGYAIGMIKAPIVLRLISPEDYGIFGMAMVAMSGFNNFTAMGTQKLIVQRKEMDDRFLSTAWMFIILRGIAISVLALSFGPIYSNIIEREIVAGILMLLALVPLFNSLVSPGMYMHEREGRFGRISLFEILWNVMDLLIATTMAYVYRNVWALVWGMVLLALAKVIISWVLFGVPVRPKFRKLREFREMVSVGKFYFLIALGSFITVQMDNLIVGKYVGVMELGYYMVAYGLIALPNMVLQQIFNRVTLPVFSKKQSSRARVDREF